MKENQSLLVTNENNKNYAAYRTRALKVQPPTSTSPLQPTKAVDPGMLNLYENLLNKPIFLQTYTWSTASTAGLNIATPQVPNIFYQSQLLQYPFQMNSKWRGKAKFIVQVQGSPFHAGTIVISTHPAGYMASLAAQSLRKSYNAVAFGSPVLMSASDSSQALIDIPFYSATPLAVCSTDLTTVGDYVTYDISSVRTCELSILVLVPLTISTSAATSVTVNLSVIFEQLEFYVPYADVPLISPFTSLLPSIEEKYLKEDEEIEPFVAESLKEHELFVAHAKGTNSAMTMISKAIDYALPTIKQWTADGIDRARAVLRYYTGLDKPTISMPLKSVRIWHHNTFNNAEGPEFQERLTYYPSHISTAQLNSFDSNIDETDLTYIATHYGVVGTASLNTVTQAPASLLFSCPVTPFPFSLNDISTLSDTGLSIPPMSLPYIHSKYWSGNIVFNIYSNMVFSQNVNLVAVVMYGGSSPNQGVPTLGTLAGFPQWQMEFSGGNQEFEFEVPYNAVTECLPTTLNWYENVSQHARLFIFLKCSATYSAGSPTHATFIVRAKGGDNITYYGPQELSTAFAVVTSTVVHPGLREATNFKAETLTDEMSKDVVETPLSVCDCVDVPTLQGNKRFINNMKPIESIRDILKRYSEKMRRIPDPSSVTPQTVELVKLVFPNRGDTTLASATGSNILAGLYFGYVGGVRIKMFNDASTIAQYVHPFYTPIADPVTAAPLTNYVQATPNTDFVAYLGGVETPINYFQYPGFQSSTTPNQFNEFEIPCEFPWRFHKNPMIQYAKDITSVAPANKAVDAASDMGTIYTKNYTPNSTDLIDTTIWSAIADEGHYGFLSMNYPITIRDGSLTSDETKIPAPYAYASAATPPGAMTSFFVSATLLP